MGMFDVLDVAGTALAAQSVRLNVTASNLANADAVSSSAGATYRARHPVFETVLRDALDAGAVEVGIAGVRVAGIVESPAPLTKEYQPDHPLADTEGYIYRPNVNLVEEMANMMSATRSYQSNVEIVNASKQMLLRTLSLGQ
jgi:flagellar basal-body rod protein FlgC